MRLLCPSCNSTLKPSHIEEWKFVCTSCNQVFEAKQLKNELDKKHRKRKNSPECTCGNKMEYHSALEEWVCPRKHRVERQLRYIE